MDLTSVLAAVTSAIGIAKKLYALEQDVEPILTAAYNLAFKGKHATQADVDALQAQNDVWSAKLQETIPPEED